MNYFAALTNVKDLDDEEVVDVSTKLTKKSGHKHTRPVVKTRDTQDAAANGGNTEEAR